MVCVHDGDVVSFLFVILVLPLAVDSYKSWC